MKSSIASTSSSSEVDTLSSDANASDGVEWVVSCSDVGRGRIVIGSGLHEGAEFFCRQNDMVVMGAGDDCDLLLADSNISHHHCLVVYGQGGFLIRALDGEVSVHNKILHPGQQATIGCEGKVVLAGVSVNLCLEKRPLSREKGHRLVAVLGSCVAVFFAFVVVVWAGLWNSDVAAETDMSVAVLDAEVSSALLVKEAKAVDLAKQVNEILRLSGIQAQSHNLESGRVEIFGRFSDTTKLERVIHSRAMQDIKGLNQVIVRNGLTLKGDISTSSDDREIARVILGEDPYLVTRDDTRYYPGAELANGNLIEKIHSTGVLVISSSGDQELLQPGSLLF